MERERRAARVRLNEAIADTWTMAKRQKSQAATVATLKSRGNSTILRHMPGIEGSITKRPFKECFRDYVDAVKKIKGFAYAKVIYKI